MNSQSYNLTTLEAMLIILLYETSTVRPSYSQILMMFFHIELWGADKVVSEYAYNNYYPIVKELKNKEIEELIYKKLNNK